MTVSNTLTQQFTIIEINTYILTVYHYCLLGLCGNADGNAANDLKNKDGSNCGRLPENMKYWCFGNSWIVGGPTGHER